MDNGVIYVATGPDFVDLAIASAKSLRLSNPALAVDLFTDDVAAIAPGLFDKVHRVPVLHDRAKLECLPLSRFARTLYIDSDTLVVGDLADIWDLLDRFDLAMTHDVRRASDLVRKGLTVATPYAFPQLNSGVILYRQCDATHIFFQDWARRYHRSGVTRDQIILKDMLWMTDIRFYVLPEEFNLRRVTVLDAWEPLDSEVKIIHSHRLQDHLRWPGSARIRDLAGLLAAERTALIAEWRGAGVEKTDDPAKLALFLATRKITER